MLNDIKNLYTRFYFLILIYQYEILVNQMLKYNFYALLNCKLKNSKFEKLIDIIIRLHVQIIWYELKSLFSPNLWIFKRRLQTLPFTNAQMIDRKVKQFCCACFISVMYLLLLSSVPSMTYCFVIYFFVLWPLTCVACDVALSNFTGVV